MADIFDRTTAQRAGDRVQLVRNALNSLKNLTDPSDPEVICVTEYVAANPALIPQLQSIQAVRQIIVNAKDVQQVFTVKGLGL